jgi:hypothetical protein
MTLYAVQYGNTRTNYPWKLVETRFITQPTLCVFCQGACRRDL